MTAHVHVIGWATSVGMALTASWTVMWKGVILNEPEAAWILACWLAAARPMV